MPNDPAPLGFTRHDHQGCVSDAMAAAEEQCCKEKLRFTPVRRKVLEILLREHRALGAYVILDKLQEEGFGSQPPVAYRALDFLVAHGLAHKIEHLNAFIACSLPGEIHSPVFLICRGCEAVAEAQSTPIRGMLASAVQSTGFNIERAVVEAEGLCPTCAEKASA